MSQILLFGTSESCSTRKVQIEPDRREVSEGGTCLSPSVGWWLGERDGISSLYLPSVQSTC